MLRAHLVLAVVIFLVLGTCCRHSEPISPLVIHVWRDASAPFADKLRHADLQFALTRPQLKGGKMVMVATNEGNSFTMLLKCFSERVPEVLIVDSQTAVPQEPSIRNQLEKAELVCGQHPAFIPTSVSGELRKASQMYLRFLVSHCEAVD